MKDGEGEEGGGGGREQGGVWRRIAFAASIQSVGTNGEDKWRAVGFWEILEILALFIWQDDILSKGN